MRLALGLLALIAAAGTARADEARLVPAAGTTLTYRVISTTKFSNHTISVGQVYSYVVTASNATTAEGTVKLVAVMYGCSEEDRGVDCVHARRSPGAHQDAGFIVVPVPPGVGDALAKQSAFKLDYFLPALRKLPIPGPKNPDDPNDVALSPDPLFVLTTALQCDMGPMGGFLPLGQAKQVSLHCTMTNDRSPRPGGRLPPAHSSEPMTAEISDRGVGKVTTPAGEWEVEKLGLKLVPQDASHPASEGDLEFAPKLGATVKSQSVTASPKLLMTVENRTELIAVTP